MPLSKSSLTVFSGARNIQKLAYFYFFVVEVFKQNRRYNCEKTTTVCKIGQKISNEFHNALNVPTISPELFLYSLLTVFDFYIPPSEKDK